MRFEVVGPCDIRIKTIITGDHAKAFRKSIKEKKDRTSELLEACGCYVFGVHTAGVHKIQPQYVGLAEHQSVLREATNMSHLQVYNEILDEFKRAQPTFYFLPLVTPSGTRIRPKPKENGENRAVRFLENWLIASALKANPELWNVRGTKLLRELWVRGLFNPTKGDQTSDSKSLKECLRL